MRYNGVYQAFEDWCKANGNKRLLRTWTDKLTDIKSKNQALPGLRNLTVSGENNAVIKNKSALSTINMCSVQNTTVNININ